jgi:hypothetical protein
MGYVTAVVKLDVSEGPELTLTLKQEISFSAGAVSGIIIR